MYIFLVIAIIDYFNQSSKIKVNINHHVQVSFPFADTYHHIHLLNHTDQKNQLIIMVN